MVEPRAVVEAADGLEALSEPNHGGAAEHHDALDHAHGGDGRVAVRPGGPVQADGRHAGKALPGQGGQASPDDLDVIGRLQLDAGDMDMEVAALGAARQEEAEADKLADDGGPGGPGHAQAEGENQKRVQGDVQNRSAGNPHHGIGRAALVAQLVVQHQGGGHPGSPEEDDLEIGLRIGQDGGGGAQEHGKGL